MLLIFSDDKGSAQGSRRELLIMFVLFTLRCEGAVTIDNCSSHALHATTLHTCALGVFIEPCSYPLVYFPTDCTGQTVLTFHLIKNISEYKQCPFGTIRKLHCTLVWDQNHFKSHFHHLASLSFKIF